MGLEGIVSKRLGSHYRSGRVDSWRKVKYWTESALVLIGTELDKRSGAPVALLARQSEEGLSYAGRRLLRTESCSCVRVALHAIGWPTARSSCTSVMRGG